MDCLFLFLNIPLKYQDNIINVLQLLIVKFKEGLINLKKNFLVAPNWKLVNFVIHMCINIHAHIHTHTYNLAKNRRLLQEITFWRNEKAYSWMCIY